MLGLLFFIFTFGGALLGYAALKPDAYRVTRKAVMRVPAEKIFPLLNDFGNWSDWSSFEKVDPSMDKAFSDQSAGKGATYEWSGNPKAGGGLMEITESTFPTHIVIEVEIDRPIESNSIMEFKLEAVDSYTNVIWSMYGRRNLKARFISIFVNLDRITGEKFDEGLDNIIRMVEGKPQKVK